MPNSYSKFDYSDIQDLGIRLRRKALFQEIQLIEPSDLLKQVLYSNLKRPLATEKAKSELIIVPILNELATINHDSFTFFSGYSFDIDKERGLKGHCDFLLSLEVVSPVIEAPVISIVEAKNADFSLGIPQCVAQMYAAQIFNERKNKPVKTIYGIVTIGDTWNFLYLDEKTPEQHTAWIDTTNFYLQDLPHLLGAFQKVIDFYKKK